MSDAAGDREARWYAGRPSARGRAQGSLPPLHVKKVHPKRAPPPPVPPSLTLAHAIYGGRLVLPPDLSPRGRRVRSARSAGHARGAAFGVTSSPREFDDTQRSGRSGNDCTDELNTTSGVAALLIHECLLCAVGDEGSDTFRSGSATPSQVSDTFDDVLTQSRTLRGTSPPSTRLQPLKLPHLADRPDRVRSCRFASQSGQHLRPLS
mmetsp:Transcript_46769/g.124129  ORF Transcript_46769/g.124129 Transcript_46769/m.124129 type:complete len:207 (-) Transcript_46769:34-654(-)